MSSYVKLYGYIKFYDDNAQVFIIYLIMCSHMNIIYDD